MRIFNQENKTRNKIEECIVIASWEEWKVIMEAMDEYCKNHPKKKKAEELKEQLELLAIY